MSEQEFLPFKQNSSVPMRTAIAACIVIGAIGLSLGYLLAHRYASASIAGGPESVDFSPVWKAWQVIDAKFVPASVATTTKIASTTEERNKQRVWGMVGGLAESLHDPYTFFLPPTENTQFTQDMSGAFEGVGMEIAVRDQILTVVSPLKGTPADKAGIKSGDQVLKIDDKDTKGIDISEAVSWIRGQKGTTVRLFIARQGWDAPREIKVIRDVINVPILTTSTKDDVFVIALQTFTSNSPELFRAALREFVESGKTKLVLDLRGNPGGYLEAAVDMASWFLPTGKVVVTEDYAGHAQNIVHRSLGYDVFNKNLSMVILVDKGSASASEILAGALQQHGIAKLVGTNTFGKGSVQELVDISPGTSLKITVARWLEPDGTHIPLAGITPDVEVKISDADLKAGKDPQLDKALELLNTK